MMIKFNQMFLLHLLRYIFVLHDLHFIGYY